MRPGDRPAASAGGIWRTKPIELLLQQADEPERRLTRSLGLLGLTAFGVAAIVGAGIFVLTGVAAARYAGPAIVLSYLLAAVVSGLAALCYAELAGCVPVAGSAYTYAYAVLGEVVAWAVGWALILEYGVGAAAVGVGWAGYVHDLLRGALGIELPRALSSSPFGSPPGVVDLPAVIVLLLLTGLLLTGTRKSGRVASAVVALKLAVVVLFVVVGAGHIDPANWHPFMPYGLAGVTTGAAVIFFAYIGFDQVSTAAEEARQPQRTVPMAIVLSLVVCTFLYVAVAAVLTGMVPASSLDNPSPVTGALLAVGLRWAGAVVAAGVVAGLTSVLLVMLFGQSRIIFAMARDGFLPGPVGRVHRRTRVPWVATLLVGVGVALLAGLTPIDTLAQLTNIGTLAAFFTVSLAVWRLRWTRPDLPRSFRVPLVPVVPLVSAGASAFLALRLPPLTLARFGAWMLLGLVVYLAWGRRRSRLNAGRAGGSRVEP
ncbi:MAG TPA: amino acid permease [Candidatus Dormibacteraeota bacterium]|nr:amino acid permease [Candidatus Dormibacteraeota bacterium]